MILDTLSIATCTRMAPEKALATKARSYQLTNLHIYVASRPFNHKPEKRISIPNAKGYTIWVLGLSFFLSALHSDRDQTNRYECKEFAVYQSVIERNLRKFFRKRQQTVRGCSYQKEPVDIEKQKRLQGQRRCICQTAGNGKAPAVLWFLPS